MQGEITFQAVSCDCKHVMREGGRNARGLPPSRETAPLGSLNVDGQIKAVGRIDVLKRKAAELLCRCQECAK